MNIVIALAVSILFVVGALTVGLFLLLFAYRVLAEWRHTAPHFEPDADLEW